MVIRSFSAILFLSLLSSSAMAGSERVYIGVGDAKDTAQRSGGYVSQQKSKSAYEDSIYYNDLQRISEPAPAREGVSAPASMPERAPVAVERRERVSSPRGKACADGKGVCSPV